MSNKKAIISEAPANALGQPKAPVYKAQKNPYSLFKAITKGGPVVWLSCLVMGLGNIVAGQALKGLLFLAVELLFINYMISPEGGLYCLKMLPSLGDQEMIEYWDEEEYCYKYIMGDDSKLILLYGVVAVCIIIGFVIFWRASVCSGYKAWSLRRRSKGGPSYWQDVKALVESKKQGQLAKAGHKLPKWVLAVISALRPVWIWVSSCFLAVRVRRIRRGIPSFLDDLKALFDSNVHKLLMFLPTALLLVFTVVPLLYMMTMAFTDYNKSNYVLFNWVGFDNFISVFDPNSAIGKQFGEVLLWTIIWAIFATFLNFIFGTIVAILINRDGTRCKGLWRGLLSLTIAVPQFVSLMVIRSMLQPEGIINRMLQDWGMLAEGQKLPFMTDTTWARVTVIIVNLWVGIPYTIVQVTGILKNIPAEQYEAARIDGANAFQQFWNITVPYMLFVMTPYLITQFTGNINNFNVIYLTTRGEPLGVGETAGGTDLLVTWLYKLSVDKQNYSMAAVIGIFTFVVLSIVSLITYRSTGSYKDEEGFK